MLPERLQSFTASLPLVLDSTGITTFMACPRKFLFSKMNTLTIANKNVHLTSGGAFAAGLEAYRRAFFMAYPPVGHVKACEAAFLAACDAWGDFGHDPERTGTKPFTSVISALFAYIEHYPSHIDTLKPLFDRHDAPASIEFSFAIPLDDFPSHPNGDPFLLAGRFDMLAIEEGTNQILWVDEKTTYSFGANWSDQWRLRFQFICYTWALQRLGYPCNGGRVRGVAMLKSRTDFLDVPIMFAPHVLEEFEDLLRDVCMRMSNYALSQDIPMTPPSFPPYFSKGCGECLFSPLCTNKNAENWRDLYSLDSWDPLRQNGERT